MLVVSLPPCSVHMPLWCPYPLVVSVPPCSDRTPCAFKCNLSHKQAFFQSEKRFKISYCDIFIKISVISVTGYFTPVYNNQKYLLASSCMPGYQALNSSPFLQGKKQNFHKKWSRQGKGIHLIKERILWFP